MDVFGFSFFSNDLWSLDYFQHVCFYRFIERGGSFIRIERELNQPLLLQKTSLTPVVDVFFHNVQTRRDIPTTNMYRLKNTWTLLSVKVLFSQNCRDWMSKEGKRPTLQHEKKRECGGFPHI